MPTYNYECRKGLAKRVINSIGGIAFKGSGFYVNDYKGK